MDLLCSSAGSELQVMPCEPLPILGTLIGWISSAKYWLLHNYGFHDNVISKIIKSRKGLFPRGRMKDIIVLLYWTKLGIVGHAKTTRILLLLFLMKFKTQKSVTDKITSNNLNSMRWDTLKPLLLIFLCFYSPYLPKLPQCLYLSCSQINRQSPWFQMTTMQGK